MARTNSDPLESAAVKRVRQVAVENLDYAIIGGIVAVVVAVVALLVTRAVVRRRRRTFWERTLDYLENLGDQGEKAVGRLKDLYSDNVDSDAIVESVSRQARNVGKELKTLDAKIAAVRDTGQKVADRMKS